MVDFISKKCEGNILARSSKYLVYNIYEDAFLKNVTTGEVIELNDFYGDPELAMIDDYEKICAVAGHDKVVVYFVEEDIIKIFKCKPEWKESMNYDGKLVTIIYEDGTSDSINIGEEIALEQV